jgi:hypothetical protein
MRSGREPTRKRQSMFVTTASPPSAANAGDAGVAAHAAAHKAATAYFAHNMLIDPFDRGTLPAAALSNVCGGSVLIA